MLYGLYMLLTLQIRFILALGFKDSIGGAFRCLGNARDLALVGESVRGWGPSSLSVHFLEEIAVARPWKGR